MMMTRDDSRDACFCVQNSVVQDRVLSLFTWPGDKILMLSGRNVVDPATAVSLGSRSRTNEKSLSRCMMNQSRKCDTNATGF